MSVYYWHTGNIQDRHARAFGDDAVEQALLQQARAFSVDLANQWCDQHSFHNRHDRNTQLAHGSAQLLTCRRFFAQLLQGLFEFSSTLRQQRVLMTHFGAFALEFSRHVVECLRQQDQFPTAAWLNARVVSALCQASRCQNQVIDWTGNEGCQDNAKRQSNNQDSNQHATADNLNLRCFLIDVGCCNAERH